MKLTTENFAVIITNVGERIHSLFVSLGIGS